MSNKPSLAIDFDGTIALCPSYPTVGDPVKGALEALEYFNQKGIRIFIWTCRGTQRDGHLIALNWLKCLEIEISGFNHNQSQVHWSDSPKIFAHEYIDDRALGCPLTEQDGHSVVNWHEVMLQLSNKYPNHINYLEWAATVESDNPKAEDSDGFID